MGNVKNRDLTPTLTPTMRFYAMRHALCLFACLKIVENGRCPYFLLIRGRVCIISQPRV